MGRNTLLNDQVSGLNDANDPQQAATGGMGFWYWMLSPFRFILREEISALQEESDGWRRRAVALEAERDELRKRVTVLENVWHEMKEYAVQLKSMMR